MARDEENVAMLEELGWRVLVVWECETRHLERLAAKLSNFLNAK
jgi:DNA mismatch endonuclease (patch repair protein)